MVSEDFGGEGNGLLAIADGVHTLTYTIVVVSGGRAWVGQAAGHKLSASTGYEDGWVT